MWLAFLALSAVVHLHPGAYHHPPVSHHKRMSAVAHTAGTRSAQGISRAITKQIAEMKAREREIAAQQEEAKKEAITKMSVQNRRSVVDRVFRPDAPEKTAAAASKANGQQGFEDPFADLHVPSFAAEAKQELKNERPLSLIKSRPKKEKKVIAELPTQAVDNDLAKKEQAVIADAGADTPSTKDFVFDVNKDPYGGVQAMLKDAEGMAKEADTKAIGEVKARQAAEKKRNEWAKKKQELVNGKSAAAAPEAPKPAADTPKVKKESLSDAIKSAKEAEARQELDHTAEALGKVWAKKTHDKNLNSELATDARVNFKVTQAKIAKVQELEDEQASDKLDDIDQQWKQLFPKTAEATKSSSWGSLAAWDKSMLQSA